MYFTNLSKFRAWHVTEPDYPKEVLLTQFSDQYLEDILWKWRISKELIDDNSPDPS